MATLGAGGLVFLTTSEIEMSSEDLYVSADEVRVTYRFVNRGADQRVLVAFPLPDITGDGDFMVNVPSEDPENVFGFETTFDGVPVEAVLHQYVFAFGIEYTDLLTGLGVPLIPFGVATLEAIDALSEADKAELMRLGLVIPMEYGVGEGMVTDYVPIWTLRSAYSWEAGFPAGEAVEVTHRYTPGVGGTVGVVFLGDPTRGYDPAAAYAEKYCTDEAFLGAVRRTLTSPDEAYSAPFTGAG